MISSSTRSTPTASMEASWRASISPPVNGSGKAGVTARGNSSCCRSRTFCSSCRRRAKSSWWAQPPSSTSRLAASKRSRERPGITRSWFATFCWFATARRWPRSSCRCGKLTREMSWIVSIGVATLSGVLALVGTGFVAALAVEWYHVSSFEGASGYFVVGMAILGLMAGCLIGLVIARIEARAAQPRFIKALGVSAATVSLILAVIAGASWMLADIPPQIGGENLFMLVEVRWPAAGGVAPDALQSAAFLRIGATRGSVVRRLEPGVAFVEDARQEDGRWIVPGAVPVFTSRGGRVLDFGAGENIIAGFVVPLPKYPREPQRRWSPWYPVARPGDPPLPDQYAYRFRVIQRSEPVRTQTVGPFQIDTVADYFYPAGDGARMAANATFRLRHNGQPMPGITSADTVAVVGGTRTALFVTIAEPEVESRCALIVEEAGAARLQSVRGCGTPLTVRRLTSDQSVFKAAAAIDPVPGWIDRAFFKEPGL